jgi:hypothetical protein
VGTLRCGHLDRRPHQPCPPSNARRIDVAHRPSPEYAPEPPETDLRVDRPEERPEWWTEKGGPAPVKTKPSLYE